MSEKLTTKSAFISIVGPSNSGKSTLINSIIGKKVSIVTHKVQTTRAILRAIFTRDDTQLVFLDTPGIFVPKFDLEKKMVGSAWKSMRSIDLVMLIIDAYHGVTSNVMDILKKLGNNAIIVINKVDLLKRDQLVKVVSEISEVCKNFKRIVAVSALKNKGINDLRDYLLTNAQEGHWYFDASSTTDAPCSFIFSEITREKLFIRVHQEVPYSSIVGTELINQKGDLLIIHQTIYVLSESHKKIVIGKGGATIKFIREMAMNEMMKMLKMRVNLFIFVKVKPDWIYDRSMKSNLSYL